MEKEFVPCNLALELKELGFNEECIMFYRGIENELVYSFEYKRFKNSQYVDKTSISAPLWQQAFRFFRNKKYQAEILWRGDFSDFCWKIGNFEYSSHFFSENGFDTYEEAELECLVKLIEIAKEQNVK